MTPSVACDVIELKTSREVWQALENLYGAASKARMIQLRKVLQTTKKDTMKMAEYLTFMNKHQEI